MAQLPPPPILSHPAEPHMENPRGDTEDSELKALRTQILFRPWLPVPGTPVTSCGLHSGGGGAASCPFCRGGSGVLELPDTPIRDQGTHSPSRQRCWLMAHSWVPSEVTPLAWRASLHP